MTPDTAPLCQAEVARIMRKAPKTIRAWTASGKLPVWFHDDNGRPFYSMTTIEAHQRRAGELQAERSAA